MRFASINAAKCGCGRHSTPDPAGGAYSAPPDSLAGFKGDATWRGWGGRERGKRELKERGGKLKQGC